MGSGTGTQGRSRRAARRAAPAAALAAAALAACALAPTAATASDPFALDLSGVSERGPAASQPGQAAAAAAPDPFVIGGQNTTGASHPWQAAILRDRASFPGQSAAKRLICGGSLITPVIVLTAAHCVIGTDPDCGISPRPGCNGVNDPGGDNTSRLDKNDIEVVIGRTTLSADGVVHQAFEEPWRYVPVGYDPQTKLLDYAFISLLQASEQPRIDIVDRKDRDDWRPGAPTRVSGYGYTVAGDDDSRSDTLRAAKVPVISDKRCDSAAVYAGLVFPSVQICAGRLEGGTDSCQGDSGGPLQTAAGAASGSTRLVGIVSFGDGCALPYRPGVYTRVAQNPLCRAIVENVAAIEGSEGVPQNLRETVVGPAGCANKQLLPNKKCKKLKKGKKRSRKCRRKTKRKRK